MSESAQSNGSCLKIADLHGLYGDSHVLQGVSLQVARGEVVTIIGRNGAGKTTTLRAIMGLLDKRSGSINVWGREVIADPPERIAKLGVGYVPEERGIYATLDVTENLLLPPRVGERRRSQGTRLSGGEQQMLAIARVLRTGARLFLLDEPTEGLAPVIVQQIRQAIELMKQDGYTILLVEQNFRFAQRLADRHYVMERGRIVDMIARADVASQSARIQTYLGI